MSQVERPGLWFNTRIQEWTFVNWRSHFPKSLIGPTYTNAIRCGGTLSVRERMSKVLERKTEASSFIEFWELFEVQEGRRGSL
ncbi:MAG: hypothetical protein CM1200mP9_00530 [Gammaproteobacteria bacterium]|nr:MAG: hypothetical protein CM1200mP9_00530 [Gammaproteobacteria bacterium]